MHQNEICLHFLSSRDACAGCSICKYIIGNPAHAPCALGLVRLYRNIPRVASDATLAFFTNCGVNWKIAHAYRTFVMEAAYK